MITTPYIEVKNLSLSLEGAEILKDVSFSLEKGKFLAIIGPNGAGKSSLLKCMGRFYRDFSGDISLDGRLVSLMKAKEIARKISWVHQSEPSFLSFTVREFAKMSRYPWQRSLGNETKEDVEIVDRALSVASVQHIADRELNTLSGGERQKALIAAALAQGTEILFLDEPTSFLDYKHQVETLELIKQINKEEKMTILLVTHDINLALHGADEILAIKLGKLRWKGDSNALLSNGVLESIFDTTFQSFTTEKQKFPYVAPKGMIF